MFFSPTRTLRVVSGSIRLSVFHISKDRRFVRRSPSGVWGHPRSLPVAGLCWLQWAHIVFLNRLPGFLQLCGHSCVCPHGWCISPCTLLSCPRIVECVPSDILGAALLEAHPSNGQVSPDLTHDVGASNVPTRSGSATPPGPAPPPLLVLGFSVTLAPGSPGLCPRPPLSKRHASSTGRWYCLAQNCPDHCPSAAGAGAPSAP